jgi:hypothetical protein
MTLDRSIDDGLGQARGDHLDGSDLITGRLVAREVHVVSGVETEETSLVKVVCPPEAYQRRCVRWLGDS